MAYLSKEEENQRLINSKQDFVLVIMESPYAPNNKYSLKEHIEYARRAMRDCLMRGEAPSASHLLYTQDGVLDDMNPEERVLGINAGLAWGRVAEKTVVYCDLGISGGMEYGIKRAKESNRPIEYRYLDN